MDAYNPRIYPGDLPARRAIAVDVPLTPRMSAAQHLAAYRERVVPAIVAHRASFVIYNAGAASARVGWLGASARTDRSPAADWLRGARASAQAQTRCLATRWAACSSLRTRSSSAMRWSSRPRAPPACPS